MLYEGLAPDLIGIYQLSIKIPADLGADLFRPGSMPLTCMTPPNEASFGADIPLAEK